MSQQLVDAEIAAHFAAFARDDSSEQQQQQQQQLEGSLAELTAKYDRSSCDDVQSSPSAVRALQRALGLAAQSCLRAQSEGSIAAELFSSRRAGLHLQSAWAAAHESGLRAVRVVGFVQDVDTESQLVQADPARFVASIVGAAPSSTAGAATAVPEEGAAATACVGGSATSPVSKSGAQWESEQRNTSGGDDEESAMLLVECSSFFVTPIPGLPYDGLLPASSDAQQQFQRPRGAASLRGKRDRDAGDPISASANNDRNTGGETATTLSGGSGQRHDAVVNSSVGSKRHRVDASGADGDEQQQQQRVNRAPAALRYPEDETGVGGASGGDDRSVWKSVLGLSIEPAHASLATGVIAVLPQSLVSSPAGEQASLTPSAVPRIFDTIEMFGFLISPHEDGNTAGGDDGDLFGAADEDDMTSRFHRIPFSVAPRMLVVAWRHLPSIDAAHRITSVPSDHPAGQTAPPEQDLFSELLALLQSRLFGGSEAAAACYLLHLVTSVTVRDASGAFGDLPLALLLLAPSTSSADSAAAASPLAQLAATAFVEQLEAVTSALRAGTVLCEGFVTAKSTRNPPRAAAASASAPSPRLLGIAKCTALNLSAATAVVPRLDYSEQAMSSCAFSLPRGAELILVSLPDLSSRGGGGDHDGELCTGAYSSNVSAIANLLIQQSLPVRYGAECEIGIDRELGVLLVGAKPVRGAATASVGSNNAVADLVGNDLFVPLRCAVPLQLGAAPGADDDVSLRTDHVGDLLERVRSRFAGWFAGCRRVYASDDSTGGCFDEPRQAAEAHFMAHSHSDLQVPATGAGPVSSSTNTLVQPSGAGWKTAMIKHSVQNTLLTMARARAALAGRKLVRVSDIDDAKRWLIAARLSAV